MLHGVRFKRDLSEPRQALLRIMQEVNFGRIENLTVEEGVPVFEPPPELVFTVKLEGRNGSSPETDLTDFALKTQVRELFAQLEALRNGVVQCLEIKHGLPFIMTIRKRMQVLG